MKQLKEILLPLGVLDEFKISGIFVNWWEELMYDFKTIVSTGWSKNLIEDEMIKEKFFRAEMEEIEKLESKVAEIDDELNELLEEVEDWDEEEQGNKTANKVKKYLEEIVKDLRANKSASIFKEAEKWEKLLSRIKQKEKELKEVNKQLKDKEKEIEIKTIQKRESLCEQEAKELLLKKFYELIDKQLEKYLNAEKKEIIKIFENLWDKYKVSLMELTDERDAEVKKLDEFLERLGYYNGRS
jgi:type I restriction enzyme M protein